METLGKKFFWSAVEEEEEKMSQSKPIRADCEKGALFPPLFEKKKEEKCFGWKEGKRNFFGVAEGRNS